MSDFKLKGNRIYLEMPPKNETKLEVDHATKEALQKEMLSKLSRLKIYAVGSTVVDEDFIVGAEVLVDPKVLTTAPVIDLSPEVSVLLVSVFDIIQVW